MHKNLPDTQNELLTEEEQETKKYQHRKKIVSIVSFSILIIFFVIIFFCIGKPLISMLQEPEQFRQWVDDHHIWGRIAFIGMIVLQVVIAIIPGEPMEIGAGYAFGTWEGMILCLIGVVIGSSIIYGFTKIFGVKMVEAFISREKLMSYRFLRFMNDQKKLNLIIFITFLIPGTPKDVLTYLIGLTPMKLYTFLWLSTIARIPSVITSTIGGDALGERQYTAAIIVFALTALFSLAAILIYRRHSLMDKAAKEAEEAEKE